MATRFATRARGQGRVRYSKLPSGRGSVRIQEDEDDMFTEDLYYTETSAKPPFKSILLALLLFLIGSALLTIGGLMIGGILGDSSEGAIPLLVLGGIAFLPGFYHLRLAFYAWKGYLGYSYADIPS